MGVVNGWEFVDVWGLESDLLAFIPRPVAAVLLLYPLSSNVDKYPIGTEKPEANLVFMKQTIGNACGTMAIIHSLANTLPLLNLEDNSYIKKLVDKLKSSEAGDRASLLESDEQLSTFHEESATAGQTEAPDADAKTNLHFVTFVEHDNKIYELDGRRGGPVEHGSTSPNKLLEDSVEVIKKFVARDPTEVQFSVIALAKID